ncbi:hypothetical protein BOTCAL_0063g00110 [Botryotinia calthae]|uniref:Uncharacterized protein n=1 Tax=Botryotinia calthae TaxID=38488 RepID=A0A4Y8D9L0_9HELO|nr:hypothetical protein BOTCAL_0063g00110 [Botryotinia calthae]
MHYTALPEQSENIEEPGARPTHREAVSKRILIEKQAHTFLTNRHLPKILSWSIISSGNHIQ